MTSGPEHPEGERQQPPPYPQQGFDRMMQQQYGAPQGTPYGPPGYVHTEPPYDKLAVAALITGGAAIVLGLASCGALLIASPAAIVLGRMGMKRIEQSEGAVGGRNLALTGFVLGIVGSVLFVCGVAFWVWLFTAAR